MTGECSLNGGVALQRSCWMISDRTIIWNRRRVCQDKTERLSSLGSPFATIPETAQKGDPSDPSCMLAIVRLGHFVSPEHCSRPFEMANLSGGNESQRLPFQAAKRNIPLVEVALPMSFYSYHSPWMALGMAGVLCSNETLNMVHSDWTKSNWSQARHPRLPYSAWTNPYIVCCRDLHGSSGQSEQHPGQES